MKDDTAKLRSALERTIGLLAAKEPCSSRWLHDREDILADARQALSELNREGESLARRFHDTYERLAPSFGYETRADTKQFDPSTPNGKLMIAVCSELAALSELDREGEDEQAIERMARAIHLYDATTGGDPTWKEMGPSGQKDCRDRARAYLAALTTPNTSEVQ